MYDAFNAFNIEIFLHYTHTHPKLSKFTSFIYHEIISDFV